MLNLYEKQKVFYDEFCCSLDRNKKLNIYFSFNFFNLLKDLYEAYDQEILYNFKDEYEIKVYLVKEQEYHNYIKEISDIKEIKLFNNPKFSTFLCQTDIENLSGEYRVFVKVFYDTKIREYSNLKLMQKNIENYEINNLSKIKIINEQKFAFFEKKATNLLDQYSFLSEPINIDQNYGISSLYEIYANNVSYQNLDKFLKNLDISRGINFEETIGANVYINFNNKNNTSRVARLNFNFRDSSGEIDKYQELIYKIFNDATNDYKKNNFLNNNFIESDKRKIVDNSRKPVSNYNLIPSLQSDSCDNNIFNNLSSPQKPEKESDVLLLLYYFNKIKEIDNNEFWAQDIKRLPVYILDKLASYNIYYLESISEESMTQNWLKLNKVRFENLNSGKYLCKVSANKSFLKNSLIENYFILEK